MSDAEKTVVTYETASGKEFTQEYEHTILDIRDFLGTAGYPWLVMAANRHLSVLKIRELLFEEAETTPGALRSLSWIQRRRWMFKAPEVDYVTDRDGNAARAKRIMAANTFCSVRQLVKILKQHGINRKREWVRLHRVTG